MSDPTRKMHLDVVDYKWTDQDAKATRLAANQIPPQPDDPKWVTPYRILPLTLPFATTTKSGDLVKFSLGTTNERWSVDRFFVAGHSWKEIPSDLGPCATIDDLCAALFKKDATLYARHDPSKMSPAAKEQFALLHFEYWANSKYRWAVSQISQADSTTGITRDGFNWTFTQSAGKLPTEAGGEKLTFVLTKDVVKGPDINATPKPKPPTPDPGGNKNTVVQLERPEIMLQHGATQLLEPMLKDGTFLGRSKITFTVKLGSDCTKTVLQIKKNGEVYYEETKDSGEFIQKGEHTWTWDGYDSDQILDTARLKKNRFTAWVTCYDAAGRSAGRSVPLRVSPVGVKWVDVRVLRKDFTIEITVYASFSNMKDIPALPVPLPVPPFVVWIGPPPPSMALDPALFEPFKATIIKGIAKHWSRLRTNAGEPSLDISGVPWKVVTECSERPDNCVPTILASPISDADRDALLNKIPDVVDKYAGIRAQAVAGGAGKRSFNLATFVDGLPVVDLYDPVVRRAGESDAALAARTELKELGRLDTGAHELGHSVLREAKDWNYSLTHKGTSTQNQEVVPTSHIPGTGEVDVMKYYVESKTKDDYETRVRADPNDTYVLISLAKVAFT